MTFIWKVTYNALDSYGFRVGRLPRTGHVRARTAAQAIKKAEKKYSGEILSVE